MQVNDIGMLELPHNGCLLEKFDFIFFGYLGSNGLHSYINRTFVGFQYSFLYSPKLSRTKMSGYSAESICNTPYISIITAFNSQLCTYILELCFTATPILQPHDYRLTTIDNRL